MATSLETQLGIALLLNFGRKRVIDLRSIRAALENDAKSRHGFILDSQVVNFLGPHGPHGLLAYLVLAFVAGLILTHAASAFHAFLFGIAIYAVFGFFKDRSEKNAIRKLELEVEQKRLEIRGIALQVGHDILQRHPSVTGTSRQAQG